MIIPCPHCQAKLNLPEDAEGREVRCPNCRHVFRAAQESPQARVQANPPAPPSSYVPPPRPMEDDPYIPRRRRREYEDDRDLRRPREERTILEENAREHMRVAGYAMLAAAIVTAADLLINHAVSFLQGFDQGRGGDVEFGLFFGIGCSVTFYLPMLVFVFLAGRDLLRLGPRGMIVTGIVMAFILSALYALNVLLQLWLAQFNPMPNSPAFLIPKFVLGSMACVFNLVAAILAMRALSQRDVQEYHALRAEDGRRYRF